MKRVLLIAASSLLLSSCALTYKHTEAKGIKWASEVCILKDEETRQGFLDVMVNWLEEKNYKPRVVHSRRQAYKCDWYLSYYGKWSWDLAIYLSDAKIYAHNNSRRVGVSEYYVTAGAWNANLAKHGSSEPRIRKMMNNLFFGEDV
ncbi:hypothetical protein H0A36_24190 [Endozoicomonas sp. SM1973]|uniref:Lipoprotein n=1 Tax=Spartinivicinus marinus TaxID=2994442 RepID=A0A853IGI5_9GAMM|nr:Sbal_3080 family lipoprotein [Spartinivicinus marinus]NYZ69124.1 hypothetical protein [Spartinivicinus marinus]